MRVGYARVSSVEQNLALQLDALTAVNCDRIFEEQISGGCSERPILEQCLQSLNPGDTLICWRLDRLGRSTIHLLAIVEGLKSRGIHFKSLTESIDTTSPTGELIFHLFAALAQFERSLIRQRCSAGIQAAMARGIHCGRPPIPEFKIEAVQQLIAGGDSVASACLKVGIDKSTYYRKKPPTSATVAP